VRGFIEARSSNEDRAVIDPRVVFVLWPRATLRGVGSGPKVARLSLNTTLTAGFAAVCLSTGIYWDIAPAESLWRSLRLGRLRRANLAT
jgi:hypothetical protein